MTPFAAPLPPFLADALLALYLFVWVIFAAYGVHRIHLIRLFRRRARDARPPDPREWPRVTVQLPVYNERYVVKRLIEEALVGHRSSFHRTPKFRIEHRGDRWRGKRYRAPWNGWALLEIAIGLYFAWTMIALAHAKMYAPLPFFILYLVGFLYVGVLSLVHAR